MWIRNSLVALGLLGAVAALADGLNNGGSGGGTVTGNQSNAASGVATGSANVPTVSYNYGFNGTTWDQLQVDASKNLKVTVASPLGASVAAPTTPVSVVEPDDFAVSGSVTSAATLFTQDMLGYQSITVEITANASANTITFETSDDNTNWVPTSGLISNAVGTTGAVLTSASQLVLYQFPKRGRYFRARVSTFVAGTITVVGNLHKNPSPSINSSTGIAGTVSTSTSLLAGVATVGKVGPGYTSAQVPITAASGNVAAGVATATLAASGSKLTYITGFEITSDGATVGVCVNPTVTGVVTGTLTFTYCAPAGALLAANPLIVEFPQPIPSSAVNTAVAVSLPSLGTGSTNATVTAHGYQE